MIGGNSRWLAILVVKLIAAEVDALYSKHLGRVQIDMDEGLMIIAFIHKSSTCSSWNHNELALGP